MRVRDFLQVVDLDSSNGTFLNRTPLLIEVGYTLRNRAILQLGHMILRVQFS
jgi:pSer/pThr/pTyr-binding forkhead associated (FHA) protein